MNKKIILISGLVILTVVIAVVYFEHQKKAIYEDLFVEFPKNYNQSLIFKYDGSILAIKPLQAHASPGTVRYGASQIKKESGSKIVYLDAYPEVDVIQEKNKIQLKEQLILKKSGHPQEFRFIVEAEGLLAKKQANGDLIFYRDLERLFIIPAPFMIDANNKKSDTKEVEMDFYPEKKLLIIKPSMDWLKKAKYPVILDPTVEISILNPRSHPQAGDIWKVEFTTRGKADLLIIPQDKATINDLDFVSLKCNDEQRTPQILENDIIFYPKWFCDKIGEITHLVNVAGEHTLRFQFGNQIAYAYNHPDWANVTWSYRKKITINSTVVSESESGETNFPMMVNIASDSDLANDAQSDGDDIMFTSSNGLTKLDHEIEKYDSTDGDLIAWVEVPSLSSTSDTILYMYYGNGSAADQSNASATWDSNFIMVQHMDDDTTASVQDSTSNSIDGTKAGANEPIETSDGQTGEAQDFDGTNDYVNLGYDPAFAFSSNRITITAWVYPTDSTENFYTLIQKNIDAGWFDWQIYTRASDAKDTAYAPVCRFEWDLVAAVADNEEAGGDFILSNNTWYFIACTYNGTAIDLYVDNSLQDSTAATETISDYSNDDAWIGANENWAEPFEGIIDEIRLSDAARSAYWISNEYNNIASSSAFYTVGTEEEAPTNIVRIKGGVRLKGGVRIK